MDRTNEVDALSNVVITGARGALGSTLTEAFLDVGCRVAGVDITVETHDEVIEDPETDGLYWRHVDATEPDSVRGAVEDIETELGSIDALINCAGGYRWSTIEDVSDEDLDFLVGANLRSGLLFVREVVPRMTDQGFGRIVLMSSKSTLSPGKGEGPYASTKAGLNALTESVAAEVKEEDVNINAVLPSIIDTEANREAMPEGDYSKWVKQEQLAEIIFRLTQSFGDPINGALLPVTGKM